jgi:phosphohistidine phosphatase
MTTLMLVRHGIAQTPKEAPDRERQLTKLGVQWARRTFQGVVALGHVPTLILASPYRRAQQTCALLEEAVAAAGHPAPERREWLGCCADGAAAEGLAYLEQLQGHGTIAVLGHEPFLGDLLRQATLRELSFLEAEVAVLTRRGAGWALAADLTHSDFI